MVALVDRIIDWMEGHRSVLPIVWILMSVLILWIDYGISPFFEFPFLFLVPVLFASWYNGKEWGLTLSVFLPLVRLYFNTVWNVPWTVLFSVLNATTRMGVLALIVVLAGRVAQQQRKLQEEVHTLEGLLPICSYCKKIKDENGNWNIMEKYISERSEAAFSHGICPDCLEERYPEIAAKMRAKGTV